MGLIFSFKIKTAKIAAKIGEVNRRLVAVPIGMVFSDQKNRVREQKPTIALRNKIGRLDPNRGIPFFINKVVQIRLVPMARKKTNSKTGRLLNCLAKRFIRLKAKEAKRMNIMAFRLGFIEG